MFGDYNLAPQKREWASISSVGIVVGGATPKTKVDAYWGGNAVWITPAELKDGNVFVDDSARKLTPEGIKSASLTLMPRNTVILSSRAPIGKVAIANCDLYCNQGFKNIICGDTLAPRYLYELLRFNSDFLNSLGKGATFKEISKKTVEEVRIPIPPISSQQEYESFVSQVDKLRFDSLAAHMIMGQICAAANDATFACAPGSCCMCTKMRFHSAKPHFGAQRSCARCTDNAGRWGTD